MDSCVRGFHVYQDVWTPIIGKALACQRETINIEDRYVIAVNKTEVDVGNMPCKILFLCAAFILLDQHFSYGSPGEKNKWKKTFMTAHRFTKFVKFFHG